MRRGRARANRRVRPALRQRIPPPGELLRAACAGCWRRRWTFVSLAAAAGLAAGSYGAGRYLATSDRFAIAEVEIRDNQRVAPEELARHLDELGGANIFRVSASRVADDVAEHPWIERARVRRDVPRGLVVEISERQPAAAAYLGGLYLIDDEGLPFVRVRPGDDAAEGLVVITGVDRQAYARDPERAQRRLRQAIAAARAYEEGDRPRLGEVHLGPRDELTFTTYEDAVAIRAEEPDLERVDEWLEGFDAAWEALTERERYAARLFRIHGSGAPERVTVDFSGLLAGN